MSDEQVDTEETAEYMRRRRYKLYIHPLDEERMRVILFMNGIEFELEVSNNMQKGKEIT